MALSSEIAHRMIEASQAKARELGVSVCTAIVDPDCRLFAFARMPEAHWASIDVSQAKAYTGAFLQIDGPALQQMPGDLLTAVSLNLGRGLLALGSVTVLREGDKLIAGIGCSGATDDQDGECARAARDAYTAA